MTVSSPSHPSRTSSSQHSSEGSDTKTAKPLSPQRHRTPISPTVSRLRALAPGTTRPSTPIPLRPSAPPALRGHSRLPSAPTVATASATGPANVSTTSVRPLRRSPKNSSPPKSHSKMESASGESGATVRSKNVLERIPAISNWASVKTLGRSTMKHGASSSPTTQRGVLSSRNGSVSEGHAKEQSSDTLDDASLIIPSLNGDDKENQSSHATLPPTPNSSVFPPSASDASSLKSTKSPSAKSVRWAEISVFPEQQVLLNIHGLLKTLIEESNQEIKDVCTLLRDYLPQPGALSERKYTLRSSQEEELEHALRILDGALYRNLDPSAIDKARRSLQRLAPAIRLRFATLPFHREVEHLRAERLQLKEERALVLVQLAIQESEIKSAQLRREAERNREIEEAALRRMKRREEKLREKQTYLGFRKLLEERSEELMELNQKIAVENERLRAARQERDTKTLEKVQKRPTPLKTVPGGSLRINTARQGDRTKCWI